MTPYYEHAGITIYHGDCRDVLEIVQQVPCDLVVTDPPYGMAFGGFRGALANVRADGARQGVRLVREMLFELQQGWLAEDAHVYVFCHWESWPDFYDAMSPYLPIKNALIWWKNRGGMGDVDLEYARDYEVILYGAKGRRALAGRRDGAVIDAFRPCGDIKTRSHPTEKPENLLAYLVEKSAPENGLVLDPFMGSGSTLVAAKRLGRRAIGIELDEQYCEIAAQRLQQEAFSFAETVSIAPPGLPVERT